jgi:eukaryotic-like serine/threonine-protein kinase
MQAPSTAPAPTPKSFALGSAPRNTQESRAFLQHRLTLFGQFFCLLSLGLFGFLALLMPARETVSLSEWFVRTGWIKLVVTAALGAVWAILGSSRIKPSLAALERIDAGLLLLLGVLASILSILLPPMPGRWFTVILAFTNIVFMRAVFVPGSPFRSGFLSALTAVPVMVAVYLIAIRDTRLAEQCSLAYFMGAMGTWCLFAIGGATVTAYIVHGLRERVREATELGQYTLVEKIGEGGMGIVYKAKHALLRRPTAIKILYADGADAGKLARFEREVQLTSQLAHPNTIAIYDYGHTAEGIFYYAMEYLDGITLEDLVREHGPQPAGRVVHILSQMCGALSEAHGIGLIHRDIKPANVLLCERGGLSDVVKVVDFGLVKSLRPAEDGRAGVSATQTNAITGTPLYLSPEAIRSPEAIDGRADLYAVGAVGYFLLTGKVVFEGGSVIEICGHHLHTPPTPPSARLGRPVAEDIEQVILRCLAKDPGARPADAIALRQALTACRDAGSWGEVEARDFWARQKARPPRAQARSRPDAFGETELAATGFAATIQLGSRGERAGSAA